jgi:hypothetical protein
MKASTRCILMCKRTVEECSSDNSWKGRESIRLGQRKKLSGKECLSCREGVKME